MFPGGGTVTIVAVTPLGRVEVMEKATGTAEPLVSVATIGAVRGRLLVPWAIVTVPGLVKVKSKAGWPTETCAVLVLPP